MMQFYNFYSCGFAEVTEIGAVKIALMIPLFYSVYILQVHITRHCERQLCHTALNIQHLVFGTVLSCCRLSSRHTDTQTLCHAVNRLRRLRYILPSFYHCFVHLLTGTTH